MASLPLVSVFIPSYNYRRFIGDAIESILAQSWTNWELIIVDDASVDGSQQLIETYRQRFPDKIKAVFLEKNVGQAQCANTGLKLCTGKYVSLLAADDVATPLRLEQGVKLLETHPDVMVAFSKVEYIDAENRPLESDLPFNDPFRSIRERLLFGNFLCATSVVARAEAFRKTEGVNPLLTTVEDYYLWVRLLADHEVVRVDDIWVKYRLHGSNLSINAPDRVRLSAMYETTATILAAIEQWPLEKIFDVGTPAEKNTPVGRAKRAKALLELSHHLLGVDERHFGGPFMCTGKAYSLMLQAVDADPAVAGLDGLRQRIYQALGDTTRAQGEPSIFVKDWYQNRIAPAQAQPAVAQSAAQPVAQPAAQNAPVAVAPRRLAVVCHLYYLEVWPEIELALNRIDQPFTLLVSTPDEQLLAVTELVHARFPAARIYPVKNRGRDIAPLFKLLEYERLEEFDAVLKIHTKKSLHLAPGFGDLWRANLLNGLVPEQGVGPIMAWFDAHPGIGMLAPANNLLNAFEMSGRKRENLPGMHEWAQRIGVDPQGFNYEFAAGSMYWVRGAFFAALRRIALKLDDFEEEAGQLDGTLAHVFERLMPLVLKSVGLSLGRVPGPNDKLPDPAVPEQAASVPVVVANPYETWLHARNLSLAEARMIDTRVDQLPQQTARFYLIDRTGNLPAISETLSTLGQQYFKGKQVSIVSPLTDPDPQSGIAWLQSADGYVAAMAEVAGVPSDWVGFVEAGDRLTLDGLLLGLLQAAEQPQWQAIYWDDDWIDDQGKPDSPRMKPDFSPDLMRAMPYADGLLLVRHSTLCAVLAAGPLEAGAEQVDLLLRVYEQFGEKAIGHIPKIGSHLARLPWRALEDHGRSAAFARAVRNHLGRLACPANLSEGLIPGTLHVQYQHSTAPLVSIIVPTKDQFGMLSRCVESVLGRTRYPNFELLIVDNNTSAPDAVAFLNGLEQMANPRIRVIRYPHPFNFSAINNHAVELAHGEYVVMLNNDTAIVQDNWLDEMMAHAQRPEVGAVGARLLYPDGKIQHAGVVLGLRGPADHPFIGMARDERGYMNRLQVTQNYSVVTAACLVIRKSIYRDLGGMDEHDFKVSYNDVDLCLKVREAGYLIVWTPFASVLHEGSVSQTQVDATAQEAKRKRFQGEQDAMYRKWMRQIGHDPYYNRNLLAHGNGFELEQRRLVSFEPISWKPPMRALVHPADQMGCGHYRMIQPFLALEAAQMVAGGLTNELMAPVDLARVDADVLVFQRQITDEQIDFLARAHKFSGAYCIYELDDYLPNLPLKSAHRDHMPRDVLKQLRRALQHVDRFVVSTQRLAEQYADLHDNFLVVNNYLPESWWSHLPERRNEYPRPRVGWAGGISHTGDLELLEGVVRELAGEVDWVFFGMCPDKLRPYIKELHEGVPIAQYPLKLASLELDLALAPLEFNEFNESKSNLRLLEYGICGFPVICTDIEPYKVDLPVTRVRNRHKDWIDGIRMHLSDLDETRRRGEALRLAVKTDWMLNGKNLETWRKAWSPD
ncbi:glycosyltransferase [Silvimonas iriomotensis]|uniref:Glycosyltransferase 2-like domain-containing protein n=1 Tax=Silvimonas iriomotensis TaxID=449662 RepID=A0ABQ2P599_9NEIS|nr:glycosyltransferase [Silvimonas iriomotensis]GGP18596.1 hypothetical protein GCM10010970_05850 [Silvimonas iriomotensis]